MWTQQLSRINDTQILNSVYKYPLTRRTHLSQPVERWSYTCMSMSWLLDNICTAKSCKGEKRVPDPLKSGLVS